MNKNVLTKTTRFVAPLVAAFGLAAPAQAASLSYVLDQSNALTDNVNYLQVTIADGSEGAIDFTVQVLDALTGIASDNFGIQSFAFNVAAGNEALALNVSNLPDGWTTRDHYRMSLFGFFDIKLYGGGNSRLSTLTFSITGIEDDTVEDYAVLSKGNATGGNQLFAARVAGFDYGELCGNPEQPVRLIKSSSKCINSAFFAGSTVTNPVPLPATAWLFAVGIGAVALRVRRRSELR
jgi:hypothetical protein